MTALAEALNRITVADLRRRGGLKWTYAGPDVLGAFVAEMDFGMAPPVEAALRGVIGAPGLRVLDRAGGPADGGRLRGVAGRGVRLGGGPGRIRPLPDVI